MFAKSLIALTALASAVSANAAVLVFNADEYNGNGQIGAFTIASWLVSLPGGEQIISANFTSNFGNSVVSSSAVGFVTVGGNTVGTCTNVGPCATGPGLPINYNFLPSEFASLVGAVDLVYNQTACCIIRLAPSTLTITTGAVPEPAAWALLIAGFGLTGAAMRRRRMAVTA